MSPVQKRMKLSACFVFLSITLLVVLPGCMDDLAPAATGQKEYTLEELAAMGGQSLAYIEAPSAIDPGMYSLGSGFVIRSDGLIVTNYHVLEGAASATVEIGGQVYSDVLVLAADPEWDLAVLKVEADGLRALPLGRGLDSVNPGEAVVALGNPEGLKGTVSNGIVSSIRYDPDLGLDLIQTTAPISEGSSGGPLLNMRGEVIGINTLTYISGQNLNFAIPVDTLKQLLDSAPAEPAYSVAEVFAGGIQPGGASPEGRADALSVEIINGSDDFIICFVYISESDSDDWGEDLLGDRVIAPGDRHTITMDRGFYDLMITDCNDYVLHTDWDITGHARVEIGGAGLVPLVVLNESDFEIAYMFISPGTSDDWGYDWLASREIIPPGTGARVFFVPPGTYDLQAYDLSEELVAEAYGLEITESATWTVSNW